MPQITAAAILQLTLLLSALPAQYLISKWSGSTAAQRHRATQRLLSAWNDLRKSYLNLTVWTDWVDQWISKFTFFTSQKEDDEGESLALEVLMHDNDQGYFGASKEARSPRPPYVLHRVGQVVLEKGNGMVGVIVSWDHRLKAPAEWIKRMYSDSEPEIPTLEHYFSHFDGKQFVMKPWLQELFPED